MQTDQMDKKGAFVFTLKAWPVVALATIVLCYLTQVVAGWTGVALPDQANVEFVKRSLTNAFASSDHFIYAACLVANVLVLAPVVEELVFRGLLFKLPGKIGAQVFRKTIGRGLVAFAVFSSAFFSAAHYIRQPWPDAAFLALFFFGLAQCWIYRKTERIWCVMLNHFLFNLTNLVLMFVLPEAAT